MRLVPNFLKFRTEPGWLSVVMREGRVDFIHVRREPGSKPRVLLADSVEKGADEADTLGALRKSMRLDRYRCTTLLAHGRYQMIQTDAVAGTAEEARETVRWRLKDQVDFPVDTAAIDLLPIPNPSQGTSYPPHGGATDGMDLLPMPSPSDGRAPQVFAALSPESSVAPLVHAFQAAKVPLAAIDLPEISQRNLAALFEEGGRGLATLIFDDDEGLLTFTANGELLVVRHVEIPVRQLTAADAGRRDMLFERIALDVQRSLDNFDRIYSSIPLTHLLVAPIPGVDGFLDYLRTNLTVSVTPLDVSGVLDIVAVPALLDPLRQFQCLRAIGAALRDEPVAA
jgi:MSHA biogenesis protein MshI